MRRENEEATTTANTNVKKEHDIDLNDDVNRRKKSVNENQDNGQQNYIGRSLTIDEDR